MGDDDSKIPETTIETFARGFFKESQNYGFKKVDYLRFVNSLLDMAMKNSETLENNNHHFKKNLKYTDQTKQIRLPIIGSRIILREYKSNDKSLLKKWISDEEGRHFLLSRTTAHETGVDDFEQDNSCHVGIITFKNEKPIGAMAYCELNEKQHRAELRKLIGEPEYRGRGYAKEATQIWIQYGIMGLQLKKIFLSTLNTNIRNIKLNEELGFQVEGILRNEVFFDGQYHDVLRMGLVVD